MTCEELEELAGALALGAALPEEVAAAHEHLTTCSRSHRSVRRLVVTAALLAQAVEPVEPPVALRQRILAAARADTGGSLVTATERRPQEPWSGSRRQAVDRLRHLKRLAVAAVLLLALGLAVWSALLQRTLDRRDAQLTAQQRVIDAIARGARVVPFRAVPELGETRGAVVWEAGQQPLVILEGLPPPPSGHVYQFWAIRGGQPEDLGVFQPGEHGRVITALPDLPGMEAVAITVEPGHMPRPTTAPVLTAQLSPRDG